MKGIIKILKRMKILQGTYVTGRTQLNKTLYIFIHILYKGILHKVDTQLYAKSLK